MTKKSLLWLLAGVMLTCLLGLAETASVRADAPNVSDLATLARYFPSDTALFATFDSSEQMFDDVDSLLAILRTSLADVIPAEVNARNLIDELLGGGFASTIRPWVGDRIAMGFLDIESLTESIPSVLVAVEVTNREAARSFLEMSMSSSVDRYTERSVRDYTLFEDSSSEQMHYLLGEDVLFISSDLAYIETTIPSGDFAKLSDNETYQETLGLLTAPGYYGVVYFDTSAVLSVAMTSEFQGDTPASMLELYQGIIDAEIHQVFGLTVLDGRTLTLDFAGNIGSYETMAALLTGGDDEITFPDPSAWPVADLAFARHLPSRSQFVMLGTALGGQIASWFDTITIYGELFQQMLSEEFSSFGMAMGSVPLLDSDWGGLAQGWATVTFAGLTGLNLEDDVLSWMTGDFALFADLIAVESELTLSLDLGFITDNTDSTAAENVLAKITNAAERYKLVNSMETHGSGSALVLPQPVRILFPPDFMVSKDVIDATPELDVMIGLSDEVFVVGSRPGTEYALNPSGESLADNAAFINAVENVFLSGSQSIFYIGFDALGEALRETGLATMSRDMADLMRVLDVFESATISTVSQSTAHSAGRLTLTLAQR